MPSRPRVVVHIGTEKTGTTSLQSVLAANAEPLRRAGIAYVTTPGRVESRGLAAAALEDRRPDEHLRAQGMAEPDGRARFRRETVAALDAAIAELSADIHTVVLSSEHFHSRLRRRSEVKWLAEVLHARASQVHVIGYLRRQVDVMNSFYSTELKNGGRRTLSQAAERMCRPDNHYFAYAKMLALWADVFGGDAVTPRVFDPDELVGGDLVTDFLSQLGAGDIPLQRPSDVRLNESLMPLGQALVRGINVELAERSDEDAVADELRAMRGEAIRVFAGQGGTLPLEEAQVMQARFDEDNAATRDRWLPGRGELFPAVTAETYRETTQAVAPTERQLEVVRETLDRAERGKTGGRPLGAFDDCAVLLRDAAVARERAELGAAQACMILAGRIRPKGPFIHDRLARYAESRRAPSWFERVRDRWRTRGAR